MTSLMDSCLNRSRSAFVACILSSFGLLPLVGVSVEPPWKYSIDLSVTGLSNEQQASLSIDPFFAVTNSGGHLLLVPSLRLRAVGAPSLDKRVFVLNQNAGGWSLTNQVSQAYLPISPSATGFQLHIRAREDGQDISESVRPEAIAVLLDASALVIEKRDTFVRFLFETNIIAGALRSVVSNFGVVSMKFEQRNTSTVSSPYFLELVVSKGTNLPAAEAVPVLAATLTKAPRETVLLNFPFSDWRGSQFSAALFWSTSSVPSWLCEQTNIMVPDFAGSSTIPAFSVVARVPEFRTGSAELQFVLREGRKPQNSWTAKLVPLNFPTSAPFVRSTIQAAVREFVVHKVPADARRTIDLLVMTGEKRLPVAGATVELYQYQGQARQRIRQYFDETDIRGKARLFYDLAPNTDFCEVYARKDGYQWDGSAVDVKRVHESKTLTLIERGSSPTTHGDAYAIAVNATAEPAANAMSPLNLLEVWLDQTNYATLSSAADGLFYLPVVGSRPEIVVGMRGFQPVRLNRPSEWTPSKVRLQKIIERCTLSIGLRDGRSGEILVGVPSLEATVYQARRKLTGAQATRSGFATLKFEYAPIDGEVQVRAEGLGFKTTNLVLQPLDLQKGRGEFAERFLWLEPLDPGCVVLVNPAVNWGSYQQVRDSLPKALEDYLQTRPPYSGGTVHFGAIGDDVRPVELRQLRSKRELLEKMMQGITQLTPTKGLIYPSEALNELTRVLRQLPDGGTWRIVMILPFSALARDSTVGAEAQLRAAVDQAVKECKAHRAIVSIVEDGGKMPQYEALCKASGGRYEQIGGGAAGTPQPGVDLRLVLSKMLE